MSVRPSSFFYPSIIHLFIKVVVLLFNGKLDRLIHFECSRSLNIINYANDVIKIKLIKYIKRAFNELKREYYFTIE